MKYAFLFSGEHIKLAKAEVLALFDKEKGKEKAELANGLLFLEVRDIKAADRLAFTNKVYSLLFSCAVKDLKERMARFNWQEVYRKDFCLRAHNSSYSEAELAGYVWRSIKKPRINLKKPKTKIELFFTSKKVYCCLLIKGIKHDFSKRRAHLRPGFTATSLNPKLARCLVNLTGIKKGALTDCFCGSGGILIEAGLIGLKLIGYDIDKKTLDKCKQNLDFYKIKKYKLLNKDALKIKNKIMHLATDLPYGQSSIIKGKNFYPDFLNMLKMNLKGKAVVVFPNSINYKKLIKEAKLQINEEFSYYIHKSLTKKIVVLENSNH